MKAARASAVVKFTDIPNVGPAMERDFRALGVKKPADLKKKDAFKMYQALSRKQGRQDPCVLDTYLAVVDFMNGAPARPWFFYTKERKKKYPNI